MMVDTFSTGSVMNAVAMATMRRKRRETRKRADQEMAMDDSRRRHGRHSSASSLSSALPGFLALSPPTLARSTPPCFPFFDLGSTWLFLVRGRCHSPPRRWVVSFLRRVDAAFTDHALARGQDSCAHHSKNERGAGARNRAGGLRSDPNPAEFDLCARPGIICQSQGSNPVQVHIN